MRKIISITTMMMLVINMSSQCVLAANDSTYIYVDCKVEESGDGTFNNPLKTIEEAKEKIREIKKESGYPKDGIVVSIREGDYTVLGGIEFSKEDSGTEDAPIIYRAYGNENVRIIGGNEVSFNKFTKVTDSDVLSKVESTVKDNLYVLDLDKYNIKPYNGLGITGMAASGMNTKGQNPTNGSTLPAIFWNGKNIRIARYPNDGYINVDKVLNEGSEMDFSQPMSFTISDTRINKWVNADNMWLWGMLKYDWADIHMPIASIDGDTGTINTKYSCDYGVMAGQRLYVYNLIEELDAPGEWYLDEKTNKLYLCPLDNDENADILMAFSSNSILKFENAEYITIRDISLLGTRSNGVNIDTSRGIKIKYCKLAYISGTGVMINGDPGGRTFGPSSYDCSVEGCHIFNTGSQGVYVHYAGNRGDLTPANCSVVNNWIHDFGTINKTYCGAVNTRGVGIDVAFNLIHDGPHLAINPGGNDITIRYNDVSRVLKETSDSGVIYFGGDTTNRGTLIENNLIHDCTTNSTQHAIHAIYNDDAGAGATIRKNIIYNVGGNGVFLNGGRNNTVENNIFANLKGVGAVLKASFISGEWYEKWETGKLGNSIFKSLVDFKSEPYKKYPNLADIEEDDPPFPKYNVMKNNVSYNCTGGQTIEPLQSGYTIKEIASWGTIGDEVVTNRDVGFINAAENKFGLKKDSSVYTTLNEFEEIDTERIGLVTSRLRKNLSKNAVAMVINEPRTYINWTRKMIDEENYDVVPFIRDNLTYVPLRYLFESFGATVEWKDNVAIVNYNGKDIKLKQNSTVAEIDGKETELVGSILNVSGRIFVPLRSCSELMDKNVFWSDKGLIIVSDKNLEEAFSYDEMVDDLVSRLSER